MLKYIILFQLVYLASHLALSYFNLSYLNHFHFNLILLLLDHLSLNLNKSYTKEKLGDQDPVFVFCSGGGSWLNVWLCCIAVLARLIMIYQVLTDTLRNCGE